MIIEEAALREGVAEGRIDLGRYALVVVTPAAGDEPHGQKPPLRIVVCLADGRGRHDGGRYSQVPLEETRPAAVVSCLHIEFIRIANPLLVRDARRARWAGSG